MKISVSRVSTILEYLQRGGKINYDGRKYVWLDNEVVREDGDQQWVIDGLAIEARKYGPGEDYNDPDAGEPYYMGQRYMPIENFFHMIEDISREEMVRVLRELRELRQQNMYD
jgi:hypothetical protein